MPGSAATREVQAMARTVAEFVRKQGIPFTTQDLRDVFEHDRTLVGPAVTHLVQTGALQRHGRLVFTPEDA